MMEKQFKSDSERRYKIRANTQSLSEQSEMIHELRDQIQACLDNPSDPERYKKINEILVVLNEVTKKNNRLIYEMQDEIAKMHEENIAPPAINSNDLSSTFFIKISLQYMCPSALTADCNSNFC